ncbi:unnamed protein product [Blepharisma stoltei]|uniref:Uncharacterized protein n=1 Tax=Blepharisma stoltei TaxID=1481888 RepID=A0AAU9IIS3_9CILI|nr:unnamed protein product [Blepharisma stoltei]
MGFASGLRAFPNFFWEVVVDDFGWGVFSGFSNCHGTNPIRGGSPLILALVMWSICSCVITRSESLSLKAGLANAAKTKPKKMMLFILLFPHNLSS